MMKINENKQQQSIPSTAPETYGPFGHYLGHGEVVQLHVVADPLVLLQEIQVAGVDVDVVQALKG